MKQASPWDLFRDPESASKSLRLSHARVNTSPVSLRPLDAEALDNCGLPEEWSDAELETVVPVLHRAVKEGNEETQLRAADILCQLDEVLCQGIGRNKDLLDKEIPAAERRQAIKVLISLLETWSRFGSFPRITSNYYRRESLGYSKLLEEEFGLDMADVKLRWQILAGLGLLDQAQHLLDNPNYRSLISRADLVYLEGKSQFLRGHFLDTALIVQDLPVEKELTNRQRLRNFWSGGHRRNDIE